ncbi:MAG: UbiD family decarboxylase [Deltaproteobacteria bacterium]|nr:UbiD family decarboxylase [Deltaproteobacteria bacterium]
MNMGKEAKDLRRFFEEVKQRYPEELVRVEREVDLRFEISAVLVKLDRAHKFPIVIFDRVQTVSGKRSVFPLLSNLFASRRLCALAFDSSVERVGLDYDLRSQNTKTPLVVAKEKAPVKQVVRKGNDLSLFDFPVPLPYHMEGGRTILGSVVTTVDNQEGTVYNCAYQTLRLLEPRKATVGLGEGTHNWERYRERVENTGKGLPVVAWIGHHPAACMGALTRVPIDVDEYSVIGGALGEPLRVTPSETWGEKFLVPADAEIVIEGIIPPKERGRHGLRADYARYYSPETLRPVMEVQAITCRRDAVYHDIHLGGRDQDHLGGIPLEGSIYRAVKQAVPTVKNVHLPSSGCSRFHVYVQIKKTAAGQGREAIVAALSVDRRLKHVVVVDEDINIFDDAEVLWAVATRSRWDRDLVVVPNMVSTTRDPTAYASSSPELAYHAYTVAKGGIDATMPAPPEPFEIRIKVPDEVMDKADLKDYLGSEALAKIPLDA